MHNTSQSLKRAASPFERDEATSPKRTRGRTGCLNCRRRRKKCDEAKPDCTKCSSRDEKCEWDTGITFRLSGLDAQHPSMLQATRPKSVVSQNGLRIVDVQFDNKIPSAPSSKAAQSKHTSSSRLGYGDCNTLPDIRSNGTSCPVESARPSTSDVFRDSNDHRSLCTIPEEPSPTCAGKSLLPKCYRFPMEQANPVDVVEDSDSSPAVIDTVVDDDEMHDYHRSNSDGSTSMPSLPWSSALSASSASSVSSQSTRNDQSKSNSLNDGVTHLNSLDCLLDDHTHELIAGDTTIDCTATLSSLENAKQRFHDQVQDLAYKAQLTHQNPSNHADESTTAFQDLRLNGESRFQGIRLVHRPSAARPLKCTKLEKRRQLILWRNYIDNIAPSLDVCGGRGYFQWTLPMLAKTTDHLQYAVLTMSSRQLEAASGSTSHAESNGLYQDAINFLHPDVQALDTSVIATSVLLCITDLLSSPHSDCTKVLKTCAALLETASINARSTGLRHALFWSFSNVATWHNLSNPGQTFLLPTRFFYPSESTSTAVSYIRSLGSGDGCAKYAIFLTSTVLSVQSSMSQLSYYEDLTKQQQSQARAQHRALADLLSDWYNCRPEDMQPLMSYPSILDDYHHPFPMILYPTVSAAIGNLLYHCASILLLKDPPLGIDTADSTNSTHNDSAPRLPGLGSTSTNYRPDITYNKGALWHARQILGILSESHDAAVLTHGRHALDVAVKVMNHGKEENEAILLLLERIDRVTGWKAGR